MSEDSTVQEHLKPFGGFRWWCLGCGEYTEKAPCEHCAAGHEEVLVIEPGQRPPESAEQAEMFFGSVNDYDWPEEAYLDV